MADTAMFSSLREPPAAPRTGWRWRTRIALGAAVLGAVVLALLAAVIARPWVLVFPVNWLLAGQDIQLVMHDARLEMPFGWRDPSRWRWRITGFGLLSKKQGTPTMMADVMGFRMPSLRKSIQMQSLVLPKAMAKGFTIFIPESHPPPPFEEKDAWPIRALAIQQAVVIDFELVMRDPSGMLIVIDEVDGQVLEFQYNFGQRTMFGHGDAQGATLSVGPITAENLRAIPIDFGGKTLLTHGYGSIRGKRSHVVFAIDGLFRPKARLHVGFDLDDGDVRSLLGSVLGEDAPDMDGRLWVEATIDTDPPNVNIAATFRLEGGEILLPEDTKKLILTALKVAPFVELKDHLVRLGPISGDVQVRKGEIVLESGLYEADKSKARIDGRMSRTELRGRVHFVPEPGSGAIEWGILLSGTAKHPKIALADPKVLEAWTVDEGGTGKEIRAELKAEDKAAREERRALRHGERKRRGGGQPAEVVPGDPVAPTDPPAPE